MCDDRRSAERQRRENADRLGATILCLSALALIGIAIVAFINWAFPRGVY